VTDAELKQFLGEWVEVKLANGEVLVGKLLTDDARIAAGNPYVVEVPEARFDAGPMYVGIQGAEAVASVHVLEAPPETLD